MNYSELIYVIQQTVKYKTESSEYYTKLAYKAPNELAKEIILDCAKDEKHHANWLKEAYYRLTGRMMDIKLEEAEVGEFYPSLREKILAGVNAGKKIRDCFLETKMDWLKDIFFKIMYDENENEIKMLLILSQR